ncbi:hypothetical protein LTS18_007372 [Coniosporium uncinatum]|uniref:Uncharacterized protein n=1 Tax=Coniosporium uncinatum TaxID=93489 RepID=A0ACC3DCA9_9PEZI|nr:hypothetical protein LTS18_007372 [Coniosporium uncinatum]
MRPPIFTALFALGTSAAYVPVPIYDKGPLHKRQNDSAEVCQMEACKMAAKMYLSNFASNYREIDPCTNFDVMVCGGWREKNEFRPDQSSIGTLQQMDERSEAILRTIMEAPYQSNNSYAGQNLTLDRQNFDKMISVYKACTDLDALKARGLKPLQDVIDNFKDQYPVEKATNKTDVEELTDIMLWLTQYGVSTFVGAGVSADDKEPDTQVVSIGAGGKTLAK